MRGFFDNYLRYIKVGSLKARASKPACEAPFIVAERERQRGYYLTELSKKPLIERLMAWYWWRSRNSSQAACSMTRLKGEVRVCSGLSPLSQLIN